MDEESTPWRPSWWDWPLHASGHLLDRMIDRRFSEVELREMLADAMDLRAGARAGRWVAECRWRGEDWEVVLEPDESSRRTIVVTAYRIH